MSLISVDLSEFPTAFGGDNFVNAKGDKLNLASCIADMLSVAQTTTPVKFLEIGQKLTVSPVVDLDESDILIIKQELEKNTTANNIIRGKAIMVLEKALLVK